MSLSISQIFNSFISRTTPRESLPVQFGSSSLAVLALPPEVELGEEENANSNKSTPSAPGVVPATTEQPEYHLFYPYSVYVWSIFCVCVCV